MFNWFRTRSTPPRRLGREHNLPNFSTSHHRKYSGFANEPGDPMVDRTDNPFPGSRLFHYYTSRGEQFDPIPTIRPNFDVARGIRVYWLGHATNLIEVNGKFIITDPVFENHVAPHAWLSWAARRITPVACPISDLPPISVVLISHNHYDHLEYSALRQIIERSPNVKIFAPLGVSDLIASWGFGANVSEFDWRQHDFDSNLRVDFTCFPARHACCRKGYDFCRSLWCSWLIQFQSISIYFPGDTAIGPHFKEVRDFVGRDIDLVMIPIGPQEPADMMRVVHLNPKDAFDMAKELGAKTVYPIHWASFSLGTEPATPDIVLWRQIWSTEREHVDTGEWVNNTKMYVLNGGESVKWNGERFVNEQRDHQERV